MSIKGTCSSVISMRYWNTTLDKTMRTKIKTYNSWLCEKGCKFCLLSATVCKF